MAGHLAPLAREGDEGQVDRVEHELDRHEDRNNIALDQKRGDTDAEQDGAEDEVVSDRNHGSVLLSGQRYRAQNGDQNQDRRDFKGQEQVFEKDAAEVAGGG